jgi:NADH-quinone oxidoreductase subunit N
MVLFNLVFRLLGDKKGQFGMNIVFMLLILASTALMMLSGYVGVVGNVISINPFSEFLFAMFTAGLLVVSIIAFHYSENYMDFAVMSNFALLGMFAVSAATSVITIFLGLELATIPMVFAILLSKRSIEAAAKLFIMASIAIAVLSFAIVLFYGDTNGFALSEYSGGEVMAFAGLLFIAALGFEASIFPFNVLIPDVYTGSPAYLTGMLGGLNKKVGLVALMQILILIFITNKQLFIFVAILSVLTMTYGNVVALVQRNTKRMLAYSSISQAGYILIGIAAATPQGVAASLFQIFSHMFIFIGMMGIVALLEKRNRTEIDELIGLNGENRYAAFAMSLFMLSLIGLPFTTGFIGKLLLFLSAVNAGLVWLAVIGIINSVISIFYYLKAIMAMYTEKDGGRPLKMNRTLAFAVFVCVVITIVLGVYPQPLISLATNAAGYMLPAT